MAYSKHELEAADGLLSLLFKSSHPPIAPDPENNNAPYHAPNAQESGPAYVTRREKTMYLNGLEVLENAVDNLYARFKRLITGRKDNELIEISDDDSDDESEERVQVQQVVVPPAVEASDAELNSSREERATRATRKAKTSGLRTLETKPRSATLEAGPSRPKRSVSRAQVTRKSPTEEMVPIGKGYAKVPKRVMLLINWDSYTTATRHLLLAVFPRRVLATHCMTGKPSPAFLNKPAKKCLDPKLVEDIVLTVTQRCKVPEHLVRKCITSKCADEAKMLRNREQSYRGRPSDSDQENNPPSSPNPNNDSSSSSSAH